MSHVSLTLVHVFSKQKRIQKPSAYIVHPTLHFAKWAVGLIFKKRKLNMSCVNITFHCKHLLNEWGDEWIGGWIDVSSWKSVCHTPQHRVLLLRCPRDGYSWARRMILAFIFRHVFALPRAERADSGPWRAAAARSLPSWIPWSRFPRTPWSQVTSLCWFYTSSLSWLLDYG